MSCTNMSLSDSDRLKWYMTVAFWTHKQQKATWEQLLSLWGLCLSGPGEINPERQPGHLTILGRGGEGRITIFMKVIRGSGGANFSGTIFWGPETLNPFDFYGGLPIRLPIRRPIRPGRRARVPPSQVEWEHWSRAPFDMTSLGGGQESARKDEPNNGLIQW